MASAYIHSKGEGFENVFQVMCYTFFFLVLNLEFWPCLSSLYCSWLFIFMFMLAIWWHPAVSGAISRWWLFWRKEFCVWPQVGSLVDKAQTVPFRISLVSLPLACGTLFSRISVGSLKENMLGTCLICGTSYDDYSSRCRCSHCRMLVLVCPTCQVESITIFFNALLMKCFLIVTLVLCSFV